MARPTKFTEETREAIFKALRAGNTRRASAAFARIAESTLGAWMAQGGDAKDRLAELADEAEELNAQKSTRKTRKRLSEIDEEAEALRPFAQFVDDVIYAEGDAETRFVGTLAACAQGGQVIRRKTVTKSFTRQDGSVSTTTTTDEVFAPRDPKPAMYWLDRRRGNEFSQRSSVALTGADGGPIAIIGYEIVPPAEDMAEPAAEATPAEEEPPAAE